MTLKDLSDAQLGRVFEKACLKGLRKTNATRWNWTFMRMAEPAYANLVAEIVSEEKRRSAKNAEIGVDK